MSRVSRTTVLTVILLVLLTAHVLGGRREEMTKTYENIEAVRINTVSGDCVIMVGEGDKVEVHLEYSIRPRDSFEPEFRERGKVLILGEDFYGSSSGHSLWTLTVPKTTEIEFETASGDFEAAGLEGDLDISTASGDVDLRDCQGDIELNTASGRINLDNLSGYIDGNTASGDIRASNLSGEITLNTASGSIDIDDSQGDFELNTASGDVDALGVVMDGRSIFTTASGRVYVQLAETSAHDLRLSSASGKVTLDYNGNPVKGYFEFVAKANRWGRISSPFDFDHEEEFYQWGDEYVMKSFTSETDEPEILIETASGRATLED